MDSPFFIRIDQRNICRSAFCQDTAFDAEELCRVHTHELDDLVDGEALLMVEHRQRRGERGLKTCDAVRRTVEGDILFFIAVRSMVRHDGIDGARLHGWNEPIPFNLHNDQFLAKTFGKLTTCDSFLKCFTELGGAAVDAVIVDKPVAVSYAAENAGFTVLDEGLGAEQYGIAFRADDAELCKTIEGAVAQLVENGTYAEIAAKYPDIQNNLTLLG